MCEYLGYEVVKLKRVRIMSVKLGTLKSGQWRNLTDKEMAGIREAIATSDNSAAASPGKKAAQKSHKTAQSKVPPTGNAKLKSGATKSGPKKVANTSGRARSGNAIGKSSAKPRKPGRRKPGSRK